jgi:N-acetylneuraminate synthase
LNVLKTFQDVFPNVTLGLSDHSEGHVAVLGAIALGARVVEKHFTDDTSRTGPDHGFSLDPKAWREMVSAARILERALGNGEKNVEANEIESRIVQRRALRFLRDMKVGEKIKESDLIPLRPCPVDGITPFELELVVGKRLTKSVQFDDQVRFSDFT